MSQEEKKLADMLHYAGVNLDPDLFQNITDLLKEDVHPEAIIKVLEKAAETSPFGDPDKQRKIKRKSEARRSGVVRSSLSSGQHIKRESRHSNS